MSHWARRILPRSLVARLTLSYAVASGVLLVVAFALLRWVLISSIEDEHHAILRNEAAELRTMLDGYPTHADVLRAEARVAPMDRTRPMYVRVLSVPDGAVVVESPGMASMLPRDVFLPKATPADVAGSDDDGGADRQVAVPAAAGAASTDGNALRPFRVFAADANFDGRHFLLQIAMDASAEHRLIAYYQKPIAIVLGIAAAISAAAGYVLARSGIRPVRRISETINQVQSSSLDRRVDAGGFPAEFTRMADTFNAMMERVEDSFDRLSRFSADIAHELRTPVGIMCGQLEVALGRARTVQDYRAALESCLEEGSRLTNLINRLLFLARAEAHEAQIGREWIAVRPELEKIAEFYEPQASDAGVSLDVDAAQNLHVHADRALLQSAIGNLVENSLAHTPRGGRVTLRAARSAGHLLLAVADTGAGIAAEHLPHVFDRFYRADPARPRQGGHAGLGLAIVRSIAILHGGSVAVDSAVGRGTTITLGLPGQDDENVISASSSGHVGEVTSAAPSNDPSIQSPAHGPAQEHR